MATMNDVAKKAGVSRGTVSNVINGNKVKEESRIKVEKAIKELGYIPNAYARGLKSQKTNTIALILPTIWNPFFSKLTTDIEDELQKYGYKLILCHSQNDYQRELDYIEMAQENKVDGILLITYSDITPFLKDQKIPLVAIERYFSQEIPFISTDNFHGGEIAAKKLHELGCKNILFCGRYSKKNQVTETRRQGFLCWCRENGIEVNEIYLDNNSEEFPQELRNKIKEIYKDDIPYDGIFAAVDRYAEYIIDELNLINSPAIPGENIQIIGFDGIPAYKNDPIRISSIRQPVEDLAKEAVDILINQIEKKTFEGYKLLNPTFIQGKTTKK